MDELSQQQREEEFLVAARNLGLIKNAPYGHPAVPDQECGEEMTVELEMGCREPEEAHRRLSAVLAGQYLALPAEARRKALRQLREADADLGRMVHALLGDSGNPPKRRRCRKQAVRTPVPAGPVLAWALVDQNNCRLDCTVAPAGSQEAGTGTRQLAEALVDSWPVNQLPRSGWRRSVTLPVQATVRELVWRRMPRPGCEHIALLAVVMTPAGCLPASAREFGLGRVGVTMPGHMACLGRVAHPEIMPGHAEWYGFVGRNQ